MRRLCFGGSFNPIHLGHLVCARAAAEAAHFDRVVLIPCARPPHKMHRRDVASAEDRLAMCRAATRGDPLFEVCDIEVRTGGPSYTIDTARKLRKLGWESVYWLVGADMFVTVPTWHQADAVLEEVRFVILARPDCPIDWDKLPPSLRRFRESLVDNPLMEISSSDIRHRVRKGLSIRYLVPPGVERYISTRGLYR